MKKILTEDLENIRLDIKDNGCKLDLKWIKEEDESDKYSLSELMEQLQEKSDAISSAVAELQELLKDVQE